MPHPGGNQQPRSGPAQHPSGLSATPSGLNPQNMTAGEMEQLLHLLGRYAAIDFHVHEQCLYAQAKSMHALHYAPSGSVSIVRKLAGGPEHDILSSGTLP